MKVILLDHIKGVGKKDEVVNASDGYARNYLFPRKLAVEANKENMSKLQAKKEAADYKKDLERQEAKKIVEKLEKIHLKVKVKTGENGKVFGGVTAKEIAEQLEKQYQIKIDKKKIEVKETIKVIGVQTIEVKLLEGIIGKLKVDVLPDEK